MNRSEYHHLEVFQGSCCRVQQDAAISGLASDRSCRFPRRDLHFRRCARHAVICSCCSVAAQYDRLVPHMQKLLIPKCPDCQDQVCRMLRPFLHSPPRRLLALPSSVKLTSKFSRERSITQPGCRQLFLLTTVPTQSVIVHHAVLVRRWIADDTFGYVLDCSAEQYDSIMLDSIPVGEGASLVFCALTGRYLFPAITSYWTMPHQCAGNQGPVAVNLWFKSNTSGNNGKEFSYLFSATSHTAQRVSAGINPYTSNSLQLMLPQVCLFTPCCQLSPEAYVMCINQGAGALHRLIATDLGL